MYSPPGLLVLPNGKFLGTSPPSSPTGQITWFEYDPVANTLSNPQNVGPSIAGFSTYLKLLKVEQTINFLPPPTKTQGDPNFELTAKASSSLPVTYTSSNNEVVTVSGSTVTIVGYGQAWITAFQGGDNNVSPATPVSRLIVVKRNQTITFQPVGTKVVGGPDFSLTATSTSELPIIFSSASTNISITNSLVKILKAGRTPILASQAGNDEYREASEDQDFCINPAKPTISVTGASTPTPTLTSSNDTGNQWYIGGNLVSGANNKTLTATNSGSYTVISTIDDCASETSNATVIVITGLEEPAQLVNIYPNAVSNDLFVDNITTSAAQLSITDALGRVVFQRDIGSGEHSIDVRTFTKGIYLVTIKSAEMTISKRILKD
jgi:hypothetical protein